MKNRWKSQQLATAQAGYTLVELLVVVVCVVILVALVLIFR